MNRIAFVLILLEFPVKSGRKVCFSKKKNYTFVIFRRQFVCCVKPYNY